jgi:hypothetical protein
MLPVVLCGFETWDCKKESRMRVLENRVPRRIFRPKRGNREMVKIAH